MVLRIHLHLLTMATGSLVTDSSGYSSQHPMEICIPAPPPPPSSSAVGRSKLQTGNRQVHRWLKTREDTPPLPFLALSIARELFCIVSNLPPLGLCFFKFNLGKDVWEQQLHRVVGVQLLPVTEAL